MSSFSQISFDDIGLDSSHQHIVQGFGSDPRGGGDSGQLSPDA